MKEGFFLLPKKFRVVFECIEGKLTKMKGKGYDKVFLIAKKANSL